MTDVEVEFDIAVDGTCSGAVVRSRGGEVIKARRALLRCSTPRVRRSLHRRESALRYAACRAVNAMIIPRLIPEFDDGLTPSAQ